MLVQCNYGSAEQLRVAGIPVAREMTLQQPCVTRLTSPPQMRRGKVADICDPKRAATADDPNEEHRGSIIIFIAFSTANSGADDGNWAADILKPAQVDRLRSEGLNPLFEATIQGVEESVVNAMVGAKTMIGANYWTVSALPHEQLQSVLRRHGMLKETVGQ